MTKSNFIKMIRSGKITGVDIREICSDKPIVHADKVKFVNKNKGFFFNNADGKAVIPPFYTNDFSYCSRHYTEKPDTFKFVIGLNNDVDYEMIFKFKDEYIPLVTDSFTLENYKSVTTAIPKYLCMLKGKNVIVQESYYSELFSTYNGETDTEDNYVTSTFEIKDLDYEVRVEYGIIPNIKIVDKKNKNTNILVLGAHFIIGDDKSVTIGGEEIEYILTVK